MYSHYNSQRLLDNRALVGGVVGLGLGDGGESLLGNLDEVASAVEGAINLAFGARDRSIVRLRKA